MLLSGRMECGMESEPGGSEASCHMQNRPAFRNRHSVVAVTTMKKL